MSLPHDAPHSLSQDLADPLARLNTLCEGGRNAPLDGVPELATEELNILGRALGLSAFELSVVLLSIGATLSAEIAGLCAKINGTAERSAPTLRIADAVYPGAAWQDFGPDSGLRRWELVQPQAGYPLLDAPLELAEFVLHWACGAPCRDPALWPYLSDLNVEAEVEAEEPVVETAIRIWRQALEGGIDPPLIHLHGQSRGRRRDVIRAIAAGLGVGADRLAGAQLPAALDDLDRVGRLIRREGFLTHRVVALEPEAAAGDPVPDISPQSERLCDMLGPFGIVSSARRIAVSREDTVALEVPDLPISGRETVWRQALGIGPDAPLTPGLEQVRIDRATARSIALLARARSPDGEITPAALLRSRREAFRGALDALTERVEPTLRLSDLVLPQRTLDLLLRLKNDTTVQTQVMEQWGYSARMTRGRGISVMFCGPSGVGKTSAAEALAFELNLDLYRIDLSQVISKYIGETEKRLSQIFEAAESGSAILLFDEGDALFGKRTEVRDGRDRYANQEVSYLLQRMESFSGMAILTTNQRDAVDGAFMRRLRYVVEFPAPNAQARELLWQSMFSDETPTNGLNYALLANLNLSGGHIRNIALQGALIARARGGAVTMDDLRIAADQEYRKLRRALTPAELQGWPAPEESDGD